MKPFGRCIWVGSASYALLFLSVPNAVGQPAAASDESSASGIAAKLIVLQATDASDDDLQKMSDALGAMKGVIRAATHLPERSVSIVALVDSAVTVEGAVRYLGLAGYPVKEAGDDMYDKIEAALRRGTIDVPTGVAGSCASSPNSTAGPAGVRLTSLAESLEPLREAFNAGKGRYRFVALLSPT